MGSYLSRALARLAPAVAVLVIGRKDGRPAARPFALTGFHWPAALMQRLRARWDEMPAAQGAAATGTALVVVRQMRCRWCAQTIRSSTTTCPICLRPLEREDIGVFDWPPWRDKDARALASDLAVPLSFEYGAGTDRGRRRILAEHLFEWAQALYLRGHEARRGQTRSYRLDQMENVVDERTGAALKGVEAIRRALLRPDGCPAAAATTMAPAEPPVAVATPPRTDETAAGAVPPVSPPPIAPAAAADFPAPPAAHPAPPHRWPAPRWDEAHDDDAPPLPAAQPASGKIALTAASSWLTPAPERQFRVREPDLPMMQAARRRSLSFAQGFVVAASIALGAAGFIAADRGPMPPATPAAQQADSTPAERGGYDRETRREMESLLRSLREATAAATAARTALPAAQAGQDAPVLPIVPSTPLTAEEVRILQTALGQLGYPTGPPDGIFGARTGAALAAWQSDRQLLQQRRPLRSLLFMVQAELAKRPRPTANARPAAAP